MESRKDSPVAGGDADEHLGLVGRHGERLVDHDVLARFESALGEGEMSRIGRCDNHEFAAFYQLADRAYPPRDVARGHDPRQFHPLACADQGRVEHCSGEAVADKADTDDSAVHE